LARMLTPSTSFERATSLKIISFAAMVERSVPY
jgi:hypothetical protein